MAAAVNANRFERAWGRNANREIASAVVPVEFGHHSDPRQVFALGRSFPAVHASASTGGSRKNLAVRVGIPKEDVSASRNLRVGNCRENQKCEGGRADLPH